MSSIPTTTTPMTKFIRTGEGMLVFAFNGVLLVVPIVSNALTPDQAVQWAAIVNGVTVVSRTGLKIVAALDSASPTDASAPPIPDAGYVPAGDAYPAADPSAADTATADSPNAPIGMQVSDAEEFGSVPPFGQAPPVPDGAEGYFAVTQESANGQPVQASWA